MIRSEEFLIGGAYAFDVSEDEIAKRAVLSPASSFQTKDLDTSRTPPGRSPLADSKVSISDIV